ncbi:type VI secretion system-associated protein TagF [Variovorax sp. MHTC-1]|uniref:type VI secretion system-associated protein TagF n=1 Tax=Variovorax sp. MHTC-1 TaxID=2495593 RepID=UPI0021AFE683|nr:type VI secretion system-associated protein TagF [Variovorax sp. MHTC-1]
MTSQQDAASNMAPGWFGKLPGMGDFANRRLPETFRSEWDRWLQQGLARLRLRHEDWTDRYLQAPLWCFVLGEGVIGAGGWLGVMMPSVDGVGRYFPFTIAAELVSSRPALQGPVLARTQHWWTLAAQVALEGLEHDLDAQRFDARLQELFAGFAAEAGEGDRPPLALPVARHSLWFTDPVAERGPGMTSKGLPQDDQFDALFGFGPDAAAQEGEAP